MTADSDAPLFGKQALGPAVRHDESMGGMPVIMEPPDAVTYPRHAPSCTCQECRTGVPFDSAEPSAGSRRVASCYLAGPIDRVEEADATTKALYLSRRRQLQHALVAEGFAVYAPHLGWLGANQQRRPCAAVDAVNRAAISACDVTVAILPRDIVARGTIEDVRQAVDAAKPCVVVSGWPGALVPIEGAITVGSVEEAMATVQAWRDGGLIGTHLHPVLPIEPVDSPPGELTEELDKRDAALAAVDHEVPLRFKMNEGVGDWAVPTRHYLDDAAIDLWVTREAAIPPGRFADVPAGCQVELPPDTFGMIVGRSSAVRKRGILVVTGIIDVGYRGDLFVGCYNVGEHTQTIDVGERIGQLIVLPNMTQHYVPTVVDTLSESERGRAGFGSTGK